MKKASYHTWPPRNGRAGGRRQPTDGPCRCMGYLCIMAGLLLLFLCIPGILMALALVAALGPGRKNLLIAIGISSIPGITRQFRALMLNVISNDYITAARAAGARDWYIILKHVLPNVMAYIVLTATGSISGMIMQISGLSYIGMGIQQPEPEWGAMLSEARTYLADGPHLMLIPALTILVVSLAFNLLGDALRDALDPRLKAE